MVGAYLVVVDLVLELGRVLLEALAVFFGDLALVHVDENDLGGLKGGLEISLAMSLVRCRCSSQMKGMKSWDERRMYLVIALAVAILILKEIGVG